MTQERAFPSAAAADLSNGAAVPFAEALRTWARVALLSFGGPAGQIAVMHRILVDEKRWIGEARFLHALNFCMLLPGPEAQQLATYIGWLMHGTRGGLVAGGLFIFPGFLAMMALSIVYVLFGPNPFVAGLFLGLKAAVVALIIQALLRIGQRALKSRLAIGIAVLALVSISVLRVPFPIIVLAAGACGFLWVRSGRGGLSQSGPHGSSRGEAKPPLLDESHLTHAAPGLRRSLKVLAIWLPLWGIPLIVIAIVAGPEHVFTKIGVFFSKMAVVTFGGAYAVLAYVAQTAVQHYHWLTAPQMMDGLGLAESTPGPLIMVVQFVGFLAGYQTPGISFPLLAGILAACLTVWVTFVPCFLWIFLGAPYVESLRRNVALSGALAAITAAVVGVIANLALWFVIHALFPVVDTRVFAGVLTLDIPRLVSVNGTLLVLMVLAVMMTFLLKWSMARVLILCALLGIAAASMPSARAAVAAVGAHLLRAMAGPPSPQKIQLADGTEALFRSDTTFTPTPTYPQVREIAVDGEAFVCAAGSDTPLVIRSRLMVLTVTGPAALRVVAWAKDSGEQVEVLKGHVVARKAYRSSYTEPDVLGSGEISMVNVTIDLMEKETLKPAETTAIEAAYADAPCLRPGAAALRQ